jgi:hypothetical protein
VQEPVEPVTEAHPTTGGDGGDEVSRLAYGLLPLAYRTLESVMRNPTRQSGPQVNAAKAILDAAAGHRQQQIAPVVPISLEQARAASAELMRRKVGG